MTSAPAPVPPGREPVGPRLLDARAPRRALVEQILAASGLCVIRGPLGTGKTYLAAMAARELQEQGRGVAWIDVRPTTGAEEIRSLVARELDEAGDLVLVLDDVDRSEDPELLEALLDLVAHHPHLTAVVTARRVTALESRLVRARIDVTRIGPELAMSVGDVVDLLEDRTAGDAVTADRLHAATSGHALTLRMLLVALDEAGVDPGLVSAGTLDLQAQRCVRELLESVVTPEQQRLLGPLSVPDRVTQHLAHALGGAEAVALLGELDGIGLGSWSGRSTAILRDGAGVFDLVLVFRRTLRADFRAREPALERTLLTEVVTSSLAERGFAVAGVAAMESGTPALLERVCREAWLGLRDVDLGLMQRALAPVLAWDLERYPTLALTVGLLLHQDVGQQRRADRYFELAVQGPVTLAPRHPYERAYLATVRSMGQRFQGRAEDAMRSATLALAAVRSLTEGSNETVPAHGFLLRNIATALFVGGDTDGALELLREAHALEEPGTDSAVLTECVLAVVAAWAGEIELAARLVQPHPRSVAAASVLGTYGASALVNARAVVAIERDDPDAYAEAADGIASLPGLVDELAALRTMTTAFGHLTRGEPHLARDVVVRARHLPSYRLVAPIWRARLDAFEVLTTYACGDREAALRLLDAASPDGDRFTELAHAAVLLASGEVERAREIITPSSGDGDADLLVREVLAAAIAVRDGDLDAARRHLAVVRDPARRGTRRGWLMLSRPDREALVALDPAGAVDDLGAGPVRGIVEIMPAGTVESVRLSERERVVLRELSQASGAAAVAASLQVSVNTVKSQLRSIYRKLGVGGRTEALARARELGLLG